MIDWNACIDTEAIDSLTPAQLAEVSAILDKLS